jgi:hypothetical protein
VIEADAVPVFPSLDQYLARLAQLDDQGAAGKNLGSGYGPARDFVVGGDADARAGLDEKSNQVGGVGKPAADFQVVVIDEQGDAGRDDSPRV